MLLPAPSVNDKMRNQKITDIPNSAGVLINARDIKVPEIIRHMRHYAMPGDHPHRFVTPVAGKMSFKALHQLRLEEDCFEFGRNSILHEKLQFGEGHVCKANKVKFQSAPTVT